MSEDCILGLLFPAVNTRADVLTYLRPTEPTTIKNRGDSKAK
jgi:hypothetical protein